MFTKLERDEVEDYNNRVLDEILEATVKKIDAFRPVHRASGLGEDLHVYDGSLMGGSIYNARKRKSGFISEFGYWSIAESAVKWGDVGWPPTPEQLVRWSSRCSFFGSTSTFIGHPKYYPTRLEWIKASLLYGAFLAKYHTEIFRRDHHDEMGIEAAGDTGKVGGDGKGDDLVFHQTDGEGLRGFLAVPHRHQGTAQL